MSVCVCDALKRLVLIHAPPQHPCTRQSVCERERERLVCVRERERDLCVCAREREGLVCVCVCVCVCVACVKEKLMCV